MANLYNVDSPINREQRNNLNATFEDIQRRFSNVSYQISILAGGQDVEDLIARIEQTIVDAQTAVQDSIAQNDVALQEALDTISAELQNIETAISNTETAATEANSAKDSALQSITDMQTFINQLRTVGTFSMGTQYYKNNIVGNGSGSSYIALNDNINVPLTDKNNWFLLVAKGDKGDKGDVGRGFEVKAYFPDLQTLETTITNPETGDAYGVGTQEPFDIYIRDGVNNVWVNNGPLQGAKGDRGEQGISAYQVAVDEGFIGSEAEWLASLKGEKGDTPDLTVIEQQLANHESRLNLLENGTNNVKADVAGLNREVAYLKLQQDAAERIEGGTVFADDMNGSRFGFEFDEANSENIKFVDGKMVMIENIDNPHSVTGATVVSGSYSTQGNGGRKLIVLDDGTLIAGVANFNQTESVLDFYKSTDDGDTWTNFAAGRVILYNGSFSLSTDGSNVYCVYTFNVSTLYFMSLKSDGSTIVSTKTIDVSQTALGSNSLTYDKTTNTLHAAWASKNSTYPNSFNIRYSKSVDSGDTWSASAQLSNGNTTGTDSKNPTIIVLSNGNPHLICEYTTGSVNRIYSYNWNGTALVYQSTIHDGGIYAQMSPSVVVDKKDVIHVVWHGKDATHTTTDYIRYSKTTNDGANWSTMQKLVAGKNASISTDKNGHIFITYENGGSTYFIKSTDGGDNWTTPTLIGTGTNPSTLTDTTLEYTVPPTIRMGTSNVLFNGDWSESFEAPSTTATAIYNIPSTEYVGTFVEKMGDVNVTAYLNDTLMTSEIEGNEYQFEGSLATETPITLRLELSRDDTTNGENDAITRILGGRS